MKLVAKEALKRESDLVVWWESPEQVVSCLAEFLSHRRPLTVELGMGSGRYLVTRALEEPDRSFLGVEIKEERLLRAVKKIRGLGLGNIRLLKGRVEGLSHIGLDNLVDELILQFPDPWPKKRHWKRRMTDEKFLTLYKVLLKPHGALLFKTDHKALFDWSVENFLKQGWEILRHDPSDDESSLDAQTEYEARFRANGLPIHHLVVRPVLHR